jgi:hypothetical protein
VIENWENKMIEAALRYGVSITHNEIDAAVAEETAKHRELPVMKISLPPIYWPPAPSQRPVDGWPDAPELPFVLYHCSSAHWTGTIKVRRILLDEFGPERAVPFTVWGHLLVEHAEKWEPLFEKYGRHETRKRFIESLVFVPALGE